jgi:hypothetical protein
MNIIDTNRLTLQQLSIPADTTQEQWTDIHRSLLVCKKSATKWLSQSRSFASDRWGLDYVAETEVQLELGLGILEPVKPEPLNPADKSKAIVTIEGVHQSFVLWQRKMSGEVETWDDDRLKRALDLLEPMEQQAKRIRELLGK